MNVIVINDNAQVNGGAAKVAIQEAVGLAERGHRVYFICAVPPVAPELLAANIEVICSHQFDLLANPNRAHAFIQGLWNSAAAEMTTRVLRNLPRRGTIIHLHVWSRALSASTVRAAIDSDIPLVCTLHDFLLACPSGTFFNHSAQAICQLEPLSSACVLSHCDTRSYAQKLWRVGRQVLQQRIGRAPSGISHLIAHSSLVADVMRPYLPADCAIHHLPIYIEGKNAGPAHPEEHERYVYLGRLVREKGVLLAAACAAAEAVPITFLGTGPLADEIRAINPAAAMAGWVDHATSVEHLRSARALIFPSLWYETLGLVVLEAAAHGIPSLVPATSAAAEVVIDGITGLHFRSGDEADLRARIRQLRDPALVRRMGRAAYERFWSSEYCSMDGHISSLAAIYRKVLQGLPAAAKPDLKAHLEVQSVG